eukprot:12739696-Ditylum_brightwellii.AAC.1
MVVDTIDPHLTLPPNQVGGILGMVMVVDMANLASIPYSNQVGGIIGMVRMIEMVDSPPTMSPN